ncbi:MAG: hypothetical protein WCI27_03170, partial [Candidatus Omnitrophota bacterium]
LALPPVKEALGLTSAFQPCLLRGLKLDARSPLNFEFIMDGGDEILSDAVFKAESDRLIRFFLAALTTPEKDIWVNLSPYENNRIVDDDFGRTTMGRELLAQDYILKQLTASLMHPDTALGKQFWGRIYDVAWKKFGTTDVPVDTFNKVWIMPASAVVYEGKGSSGDQGGKTLSAFIDQARLKVMLETDYLASERAVASPGSNVPVAGNDMPAISRQLVREVILPALEKEVNEGKNFARLRQVYYALLLSVWLKKKLRTAALHAGVEKKDNNILSLVFVNHKKTAGIETVDPQAAINGIYALYVQAFKEGVYNLIREDYEKNSGELIPRKYFSGGFSAGDAEKIMDMSEGVPPDNAARLFRVLSKVSPANIKLDVSKWTKRAITFAVGGAFVSIGYVFQNATTLLPYSLFEKKGASASGFYDWRIRQVFVKRGEYTKAGDIKYWVQAKRDQQIVDVALNDVLNNVNENIQKPNKWEILTAPKVFQRLGLSPQELSQGLRDGWEKAPHLQKLMSFEQFVNTFLSLAYTESGFDRNMISGKHAKGAWRVLIKAPVNLYDSKVCLKYAVQILDDYVAYLNAPNKVFNDSRAAALARVIKEHGHTLVKQAFLTKGGALNGEAQISLVLAFYNKGPSGGVTGDYSILKKVFEHPDDSWDFKSTPSGFATKVVFLSNPSTFDGNAFIGPLKYSLVAAVVDGTAIPIASLSAEIKKDDGRNNAQETVTGGIDLKTEAMDLLMRGQGGDIAFELTPAQVDLLRQGVSGFVPVILDVKPMENMPRFMGFDSK